MAPSSTRTLAYVGTSYGVTPKRREPSARRSSSEPGDTDCGADRDNREAAGDDRSGNVYQPRAKRDADADVFRPFSDKIGEQTVEAKRRQHQTANAEAC